MTSRDRRKLARLLFCHLLDEIKTILNVQLLTRFQQKNDFFLKELKQNFIFSDLKVREI